MGSSSRSGLPGALLGLLGVAAIIGGFVTGGPDALGGMAFGGVALAAAAVILHRRSIETGGTGPESRDRNGQ